MRWEEVYQVRTAERIYVDGKEEVEKIIYHEAETCDPHHYCDLSMQNGTTKRIFNLISIEEK